MANARADAKNVDWIAMNVRFMCANRENGDL
ncbi:predicted protein [Sclerotinia sclerotiorum 1980 UF-70]|uniref:Uncharacterized protein n=1 Tax=Sclerotinia sclerotiorum (strain ATCC 18683 / 1980 / Ss-1) TaxID=665079 RepID=A7EC63_SCLS1|nr:predicted protein [Sclerotinia sclerotiorum 1980 UF-70]EDO00042.1 predicted protein [Sclerotinia sclerotiorum 1980 UF-70]